MIKDLMFTLMLPHEHKGYHFQVVEQIPEEECLTGEQAYVVIEPLKKEGAYEYAYVAPFIYKLRFQVWSLSSALSDEIGNEILRRLMSKGCSRYWQSREMFLNPASLEEGLRAWVCYVTISGLAGG